MTRLITTTKDQSILRRYWTEFLSSMKDNLPDRDDKLRQFQEKARELRS